MQVVEYMSCKLYFLVKSHDYKFLTYIKESAVSTGRVLNFNNKDKHYTQYPITIICRMFTTYQFASAIIKL
jgi:hypothetical protein